MKIWLASLFPLTDEQAMWRVQTQDDENAFAQLMARWEEPIRRLGIRMLGDEHKASDVCQEAFSRIYNKRKDYQHGSRFSTFLWRVATNLCLDELRRIKRRAEFTLVPVSDDDSRSWEDFPADERSPDAALQASEKAEMVQRALNQLPEHYKTVVILRHYQNLKFREIAEVLSIPEGTVKSRMSEALGILAGLINKSTKESARSGTKFKPVHPRFESIIL